MLNHIHENKIFYFFGLFKVEYIHEKIMLDIIKDLEFMHKKNNVYNILLFILSLCKNITINKHYFI